MRSPARSSAAALGPTRAIWPNEEPRAGPHRYGTALAGKRAGAEGDARARPTVRTQRAGPSAKCWVRHSRKREGQLMASTSRRTSPPFRADHVGSLLRPRRLLEARDDFAVGRITAADLRAAEDEEIIGAIRRQEEIGLQSATDGEFRRASWHMDFIYALGGISKAPGNMAVKFNNPSGNIVWTPAALHIGGRVKLEHPIFGEDFSFVRSHVT